MTFSDSFSSSVWAGVALTYCAERILTYGAAGEGNVFGYAPVLMEDEDTMGQSCPLRFYLDRAGTGTQAVRQASSCPPWRRCFIFPLICRHGGIDARR